MGKPALLDVPLIERPIEDILTAARAAGYSAFSPRDVVGAAWEDAAFAWLETKIPESLDLSDNAFKNLAEKVQAAFKTGIEDCVGGASQTAPVGAPRLPGVGYWFSEDNSFAFGLMVDLSEFMVDHFDGDALYERFHARLMAEFEKLRFQSDAARADNVDVYPVDPEEDVPLSISMPVDDTIYLQIVPAAIDRDALIQRLPEMLREFVGMLEDPFPNAI